jgi:hypothetical protein
VNYWYTANVTRPWDAAKRPLGGRGPEIREPPNGWRVSLGDIPRLDVRVVFQGGAPLMGRSRPVSIGLAVVASVLRGNDHARIELNTLLRGQWTLARRRGLIDPFQIRSSEGGGSQPSR